MADKDSVFVINEPYAGLEQRSTKSGKSRFNLVVKSEPIRIDLDERRLAAPVAQALAFHLREKVKVIAAQAPLATLRAREVAAKATAAGKTWATRRFSGGRTGAMPPNQSDRAFNDSGRFAETIVAGVDSKGTWRVNVAANRLTDKDSGGAARVFKRLVELVPDFADLSIAMASNTLLAAKVASMRLGIQKGKATTGKATFTDFARAAFGTVERIGNIIGGG